MRVAAPAKLNLCLYLGAIRPDGLHEIRSLFEPLELADEIEVSEAGGTERGGAGATAGPDTVVCEGVEGENLVERALAGLRERGWARPPLRVEIRKRIPVAAGLGGGSADAAAILRLAEGEVEEAEQLAIALGADVPSQLRPRPCLVGGAGERIEPVRAPGAHAVVLVPQREGLSTAAVYAEADRLGPAREGEELDRIEGELREAFAAGASPLERRELLVNDLEPAAVSLRPETGEVLDALRAAGAAHAMVTGSGPTAFGLFESDEEAGAAAGRLRERYPLTVSTRPLAGGAPEGEA